MSYRYVNANDVVDIVDMETQNKINEMDCVYIDGIKPNNQHFNLAEHDKQIRDEVIEQCMDVVPFRIDDGDYSDGFNACSKKY